MTFARVAIDSPLPQLDRLFDYAIPQHLVDSVKPGVRVQVPFGRGTAKHSAFVVELVQTPSFDGQLSEVAEVISPLTVLTADIYKLARAVADRQAATASDVLKLAIPARSVAVEKKAIDQAGEIIAALNKPQGLRETALQQPVQIADEPLWVAEFLARIKSEVSQGRSTIAIVPDYRDQALLLSALAKSEFADQVVGDPGADVLCTRLSENLYPYGVWA